MSEDIHFIGVGESIHKTLPLAINKFYCTKLVLLVEENVFTEPGPPKKKQILDAIEAVGTTSKMLDIPLETGLMPKIDIPSIRDAVLLSYSKNPSANYYFNVTGGTKVLSNGLFLMSIWLGGTSYYIDQEDGVMILNVPRVQISEVRRNPNYVSILRILEEYPHGIRPKDLLEKLRPEYIRFRETDRVVRGELQKGTLSKWVGNLLEWNLLNESPVENSRKGKLLSLTEDGTFALRFIEASEKHPRIEGN